MFSCGSHNRSGHRNSVVGSSQTHTQGHRLAHINPHRSRGNILVNDTLNFKNMATKRKSKTLEQQARYYEVDDISEYMVETYLNGNISTYRQLFQELRAESRREFVRRLFEMEITPTEIERMILATL